MMYQVSIQSPVGPLTLCQEGEAITRLSWGGAFTQTTEILRAATQQLEAYFAGELTRFDLPLKVYGSDFQRAVCAAMRAIPLGETRSYGDLARELGAPAQAIGQACGANPIPIIIPCHRILSAKGLGGFSGGIGVETKIWLLRHERAAGLLI